MSFGSAEHPREGQRELTYSGPCGHTVARREEGIWKDSPDETACKGAGQLLVEGVGAIMRKRRVATTPASLGKSNVFRFSSPI